MVSKTALKVVAIIVGFLAFVFAIVGICTNNWRTNGSDTLGLWKRCDESTCIDIQVGHREEYFAFEIVRGFAVLAICMAFGGIMFGFLSLVVKKMKVDPSVLATFFMMGAFFGLVSAAVFTSLEHSSTTDWGYSFILTWLAFPLSLGAGAILIGAQAQ